MKTRRPRRASAQRSPPRTQLTAGAEAVSVYGASPCVAALSRSPRTGASGGFIPLEKFWLGDGPEPGFLCSVCLVCVGFSVGLRD